MFSNEFVDFPALVKLKLWKKFEAIAQKWHEIAQIIGILSFCRAFKEVYYILR